MTTAYLKKLTLAGGVPTTGDGDVSTIDGLMCTAAVLGATPLVTTGQAYGANYVVGGKLTFANIMLAKGSGVLQSVRATFKQRQINGFTLFLFTADPTSSTFVDSQVANISALDAPKVLPPIALSLNSQLGNGHTIGYATGLGMAVALGHDVTTMYGVLVANATLTTNFTGVNDVTVELTMFQDGGS